MQSILSRFSSAAGFKEVSPVIKLVNSFVDGEPHVPLSRFRVPVNAKNFTFGLGKIQLVPSVIGWSKFRPPVISTVVMLVVNVRRRLFAGHQKISDSVSVIEAISPLNVTVSVRVNAPSNLANAAFVSRFNPNQITRIRAVLQDFTDRFGYKFHSHSDTSYVGLVRGLVTAITSTPILPQNPHTLRIGALNV